MNYNNNLPLYTVPVPGMPIMTPPPIQPDTPIYSAYTNELIQRGPIQRNSIITDAPPTHNRHGKPFHVVQYIQSNNTYYAHGNRPW